LFYDYQMIRLAKVEDATTVHALMLAARESIPLADNFADDAHKQWVRERCKKRECWIDERDDTIAGIMVLTVTEIAYLVTDATWFRNGIASGLVDHAVTVVRRRFRRETGVTVRAREDNTPIINLLEKKGFYRHPTRESVGQYWTIFAFGYVP
jgi:ribosomal protein S18 acetylase RimI-like enzyme